MTTENTIPDDITGIFDHARVEDFIRPDHLPGSVLDEHTFWLPYEPRGVTHITDTGDLVLDIRDLFTPMGFWRGNLVRIWAEVQMLSLDGLDERDVFLNILHDSLIPALLTLPDGERLMRAFEASRAGAPAPDLPDFRIIVNGDLALIRTVTAFDGPFTTDLEAMRAIARRLAHFSDHPDKEDTQATGR